MTEFEQYQKTITVLETHRSILGDDVVDTAVEVLQKQISKLDSQVSGQKRKQVTVLFADFSGFTALAEKYDPELVAEWMNTLWIQLDSMIVRWGGWIDKHIGDCVMALWGTDIAQEDDAERAIRCALEMQSVVTAFDKQHVLSLSMRIGLNSGPVLLGAVGSTNEFTAMGDTVNLASRLQHAAPPDKILISQVTYDLVRGLFDVSTMEPLFVKGKSEPVQSYLILQARPRNFRMNTRGVEGIQTRLVGRADEIRVLQRAALEVFDDSRSRMVLLTGEAGMGKSRLLREFEGWLSQRIETIIWLRGRSFPAMHSVLRDMFAHQFDILEVDDPATALNKFRIGMAGILPAERADIVGHAIGFDFSCSPVVKSLSGSVDFSNMAQVDLIEYFRVKSQQFPLVLLLDDMHWADERLLTWIEEWVRALPHSRLLVVMLARPAIFERHSEWRKERSFLYRIALEPLSEQQSSQLVEEILQKAAAIPQTLPDLIVSNSDGNPYFIEEMIRMLIHQGVIEVGDAWHVHLDRLQQAQVPPTLIGLLQARLDGLPPVERRILQRAAVIGRQFWDAALEMMEPEDTEPFSAALQSICEREFVEYSERSTFAGAREYIFKNAMLRDVAYEMVLLKQRRIYHFRVAQWMEQHAGQRLNEYAGWIAEHLECAGKTEDAAGYLRPVIEKAIQTGDYRQALNLARRALTWVTQESPYRAELLTLAGQALYLLSELDDAQLYLKEALALAEEQNQDCTATKILHHLGMLALTQGNFLPAMTWLEQSLVLAREQNEISLEAQALWGLGWGCIRQGLYLQAETYMEASRAIYLELGDRLLLGRVLTGLSVIAQNGACDYERARQFNLQALELARQIGDRGRVVISLINLGENMRGQGYYQDAKQYYQEAVELAGQLGDRLNVLIATNNLGHVAVAMEEYDAARTWYEKVLSSVHQMGVLPVTLESMVGLARILAWKGELEQALKLLGAATHHPALYDEVCSLIEDVLIFLRNHCSEAQIQAGLACGQLTPVEDIIKSILVSEYAENGL